MPKLGNQDMVHSKPDDKSLLAVSNANSLQPVLKGPYIYDVGKEGEGYDDFKTIFRRY